MTFSPSMVARRLTIAVGVGSGALVPLLSMGLAAPAGAASDGTGTVFLGALSDVRGITDDGVTVIALSATGQAGVLRLVDTRTAAQMDLGPAPGSAAYAISGDGSRYSIGNTIYDRAGSVVFVAPDRSPSPDYGGADVAPRPSLITALSRTGEFYGAASTRWADPVPPGNTVTPGYTQLCGVGSVSGRLTTTSGEPFQITGVGPFASNEPLCRVQDISDDGTVLYALTSRREGSGRSVDANVYRSDGSATQLVVGARLGGGSSFREGSLTSDGSLAVVGQRVNRAPGIAALRIDVATQTVAETTFGLPFVPRNPVVSGDGRYLAYGGPDSNIYRLELATGTVEQVSVGLKGEAPNAPSGGPVIINHDGSTIVFGSAATNLTAAGRSGAFVRHLNVAPPANLTPAQASVARLYAAVLLRQPDPGGFAYWSGELASGARSLDAIAARFIESPEFSTTYGSVSDDVFVTLVYRNVHGRDPDGEGYDFWLDLLRSGTISRAQLLVDFSESPEFRCRSGIT